MIMTDEQKYNAVLKELGELLQSKNTTISCQKWQIDNLKEKLEAAEAERDELRAAAQKNVSETHLLLDSEAVAALRAANETLRDCFDRMDANGGCAAYVETLQNVQLVIASFLPIKEVA